MQHSNEFMNLVNALRAHIKEVDADTVHQWQQDGKAFVLVDVREDREWLKGHIPNAIHIGKGVIERDIATTIPNKMPVLYYNVVAVAVLYWQHIIYN